MILQLLLNEIIGRVGKQKRLIIVIFALVMLLAMVLMFLVEGTSHNYRDIADYLNWVLSVPTTTGSTAMPETFAGRLLEALMKVPLFLTGFLGLAAIAIALVEKITSDRRGEGTFRGKEHILIIGWNAVTQKLAAKYDPTRKIVVLDEVLERTPSRASFFVRGDPTRDANLIRAGVQGAAIVIVTLPDDGSTLLTTRSVRRLNPKASVTAVAVDQENFDRLSEVRTVKVLCAVETIANVIMVELRGREALVFGKGPIVRYLKTLQIPLLKFDAGNPGVDGDLICADVKNYPIVIVEPDHEPDYDGNGILAASSVRAQAPDTFIIVVMVDEENEPHLMDAGADFVLCPTTIITQ